MSVDEIIERLGGVRMAATTLGLKRTTVAMWRRNGAVPLRHVPAVARALGVPVADVWPALAPTPAPAAAQPREAPRLVAQEAA
jgi:DNA-binding transcriptional regulator YdaS (Cro superfamily)